jgi:hypothetical protein
MATGGEPGPEVGEPPGGGKEGVSMLTGNEQGQKAGEFPVTWPSPKDNKAASAFRSCSKKTKKRRKKGGGTANLVLPSRIEFHQHTLSKEIFLALLPRFCGLLARSKSAGSFLFRV